MQSAPGFKNHPEHKVELKPLGQDCIASLGGEEIARTSHAIRLEESGYPERLYFPIGDVKADCLKPSETHSYCPFKGTARYWDIAVQGQIVSDGAWGYDDPYFECADIAGYVCFYTEKADFNFILS